MTVYLGADHRGFAQKEALKQWLIAEGYVVIDCGNFVLDPNDDNPQFAIAVAQRVQQDSDSRGIVCCGSGVGVSIAANKVKGIRCGLLFDVKQATAARKDDDINVLALASEYTDHEYAKEIVTAFLTTSFSGEERYRRRIDQIRAQEQGNI
jgi:ribose 5-phosphate isomerase B